MSVASTGAGVSVGVAVGVGACIAASCADGRGSAAIEALRGGQRGERVDEAHASGEIGRLAALAVPATSFVDHIQVIVTTLITLALYIPLIAWLAPQDWADLKSRVTELAGTSGIRERSERFSIGSSRKGL